MNNDIETIARRLCVNAGYHPEACNELVTLTERPRYRTPRGDAWGAVIEDIRPLWMLWLDEAINVRAMLVEVSLRESGGSDGTS